jgi:hypothetical protein
MPRPLTTLLLLLTAISATAQSPPGARFSGNATLKAAAPASADGRFSLSADLKAIDVIQTSRRYALDAHLKVHRDAKSIAADCGPVGTNIFSNGFE